MQPLTRFKPSTASSTATYHKPYVSLPRSRKPAVGNRKRNGRRRPILTLKAFIAAHDYSRLIEYAKYPPRRDSVRVAHTVVDELCDDGVYPYANNSAARIAWAEIAADEGRRFLKTAPDLGFFFGTLTLAEFMVPYKDAKILDLNKVQESARRRFKGLNFVGIVEPALYTRTAQLDRPGRYICWHVHFVAWDVSSNRIRKARDRINRNNVSAVPGIKPAHYRPLETEEEVLSAIFYMFKGPQSDHRVYARVEEWAEPETGELRKRPTGRYTQAKGPLRLGDAARMANLLEGIRLDELVFANGREGRALLKRIVDRALAPLRAYESRKLGRRR